MSELEVQPVQSRRQKKRFLDFPWRLYRDDPLWVPPLRGEEADLVGFCLHPFYQAAESQAFLALRGGEVCGRIAAIDNPVHNEAHGEKRGFFGFFECRDDRQVAAALLRAARDWLAARGLRQLRGPTNPSINYTIGTLVEGFDRAPVFLMPYNPAYYGPLLEACGLRKTQDLYAYHGDVEMLPTIRVKTDPLAEQINRRYGIRYRTLDRSRFVEDVEQFLSIFNRSLVGHWGFVPPSPAEVKYLARGLSWLLVPELAVGAEIDGELVGVAFVLPDYNPRIKKIRGRLFPFGFIRLLAGRRRIKSYRLVAANVLPAYQLHGVGLGLMGALLSEGLGRNPREVEFSWVAESNALSRGALEKGGARRYKTYRVYDQEL